MKTSNAQNAGAKLALIIDNEFSKTSGSTLIDDGYGFGIIVGYPIKIPTVMISFLDGKRIMQSLSKVGSDSQKAVVI